MRNDQLSIQTPEGITFTLPVAGPVSRCMAWLLDAACISVAAKIAGAVIGMLGLISLDLTRALTIVVFFLLNMGYAIALEWAWQGQTVGKRVVGLRVMDVRGMRLHGSQVVIRNLLRAVDSLPLFYLLGGLTCLISRYGQRLGDLAANTVVIKEAKVAQPDLDLLIEPSRYNSLSRHPHLVARLRQQTTPHEAGLALQSLLRRNEFEPEARVDLFRLIASHFKQKVTFPEAALEGISDEQYVRDVIDVLFRTGPTG